MSDLNEPQQQAVEHTDGALLIFAGAGSGKTRVITYRTANLIRQGVDPGSILLVTFTNKAAAEMRERMKKVVDGSLKGLVAGTFHSVCAAGLRKRASMINRTADFAIYGPDEQETVLRQVLEEKGYDKKQFKVAELAESIGKQKQKGLLPDNVHPETPDEYKLVDIWGEYENWMVNENALDFEDLIAHMMRLAESDTDTGDELRSRFTHVMCDEFQDTNMTQYRLLRSFASRGNLGVVGDDDQCHPPGVLVEIGPGHEVPIEELELDPPVRTVRGWNRNAQKMVGGRKFEISGRRYSGPMLNVTVEAKTVGANRTVPCTPNHRFIVRWADRQSNACATYLMWRRGFGYRVGWCKLFINAKRVTTFHLAHRARIEKADKVWVLKVHKDRTDASVYESIVAAKYGITTATFQPVHGAIHLTAKAIRRIFVGTDGCERGGRLALHEHGLDEDLPLYPWPGQRPVQGQGRRTYFEVYAANLLPDLMALPLPDGPNTWSTIRDVSTRPFNGYVYSLDVEKDHSYAANGIVVKNSIYSWRGADRRIIRNFRKDYPDATVVKLEQNYRSTKHIVASALGVVGRNVDREAKQLWTDNEDGARVSVIGCPDDLEEGKFVAGRIKWLLRMGRTAGEIAILYRTHYVSRPIEDALRLEGIPYYVVGGHTFYERKEVKDCLAYLRLATNTSSNVDLIRIINKPVRGIGAGTIKKLGEIAKRRGTSMWNALEAAAASPDVRLKERQQLSLFRTMMGRLYAEVDTMRPAEAAAHVIEQTGYKRMWLDEAAEASKRSDMEQHTERANKCDQVVDSVLSHERRMSEHGETATMRTYIQEVALLTERDTADATEKVALMTVHAAKGLEFEFVFLISFEEGIFPISVKNPDDLEEERRLAYVAITRARRQLWITYTARRLKYGEVISSKPSMFIGEMPKESYVPLQQFEYEQKERATTNRVSMDPQLAAGKGVLP